MTFFDKVKHLPEDIKRAFHIVIAEYESLKERVEALEAALNKSAGVSPKKDSIVDPSHVKSASKGKISASPKK